MEHFLLNPWTPLFISTKSFKNVFNMLNIFQVALAATILCATGLRAVTGVSDVAKLSRPNESAPTCPSHTINYITQTLPQQCLATTWTKHISATRATNNSQATDTSVTFSQTGAFNQIANTSSTGNATATVSIAATITAETHQVTAASSVHAGVSAQPTTDSEQESDTDPFSDKGNFLSFEEWKKQMLEKAGQSPDHIGTGTKGIAAGQNRRRPGDINNALDTLGDDSEIELDFGGFVNTDNAPRPFDVKKEEEAQTGTHKGDGADSDSDNRLTRKSKDAGTTCKERFNYASFDCAATVLKTNSESKGSTSVLVENKDSYMLNPCKAKNKFFIVELCNDILIDTVVLANFEFFSSTFRTFRVSVADRYPVKAEKWKELGTFEARNTREIQPFLVENGLIFTRYLRFEFLTHYGVEYYCPVSLLRVHGKTMMDDFNEFRANRGDEDAGEDAELENEEKSNGSEKGDAAKEPEEAAKEEMEDLEASRLDGEQASPSGVPNATAHAISTLDELTESTLPSTGKDLSVWVSYDSPLFESHNLVMKSCNSSVTVCHLEHSELLKRTLTTTTVSKKNSSAISDSSTASSTSSSNEPTPPLSQHATMFTNSSTLPNKTEVKMSNQNNTQSSQATKVATTQPSPSTKSNPPSSQHSTKTTPTTPPAATPSTQESFFKSIAKRLQHLEQNSTLSLQYIEEQSRLLREAFTKVEKRQLSKTSNFLENLNTTVLKELRDFRILYDQMWQSTVLELSSQRQSSQQEIVALSARLSILADETLFHKRMVVVQFFLILVCLVLLVFSRMSSSPGGPAYADLQSAVRDVVSKPSVHLSRYLNLESPPGSPPGTRPVSRYGFFSGRTLVRGAEEYTRSASTESTAIDHEAKINGPAGALSPASADEENQSPVGEEEEVEGESPEEKEGSQSPEAQQAALLRSWSSPEMGSQLQTVAAEEEAAESVDAVDGQTAGMDSFAVTPELDDVSENVASQTTPLIRVTSSSADDSPGSITDYMHRQLVTT